MSSQNRPPDKAFLGFSMTRGILVTRSGAVETSTSEIGNSLTGAGITSGVPEDSQVGAKHVGHGVGMSYDFSGSSGSLRKLLSDRAERRHDQVGG
jgi:hypothetical protein